MSTMLSKSFPVSFNFTMDEEAKACEKQGIMSVTGSDSGKTNTDTTTPSLGPTLSVGMSSKKWLAENGFSPAVKKISSSHDELLASTVDSYSASTDAEGEEDLDDDDEKERLDIWNSIREAKLEEDRERGQKTNEMTSWSSILFQKGKGKGKGKGEDSRIPLPPPPPPPYVHPLVKRSASALSEKSLEICTESLGSETGSDGFSSDPPSEDQVEEDDKGAEESLTVPRDQAPKEDDYVLSPNLRHNHPLGPKKAAQSRAFPPPIPSLSRENGASLSLRSTRSSGRFVLEAVSISSHNNFQAQRRDGRLILTFMDHRTCTPLQQVENDIEGVIEEEEEEEKSVMIGLDCCLYEGSEDEDNGIDQETDEAEGKVETACLMLDSLIYGAQMETCSRFPVEKAAPNMPGGLMIKTPIGLLSNTTPNPMWASNKFNEQVVSKFTEDLEEVVTVPVPVPVSLLQQQSLRLLQPPQVGARAMIPTPSAAKPKPTPSSIFNAYDYFWRTKSITKQPAASSTSPAKNSTPHNVYYSMSKLSSMKSYNEPRRSSFFCREPNCVASS